jgi:hypothetical protein
MGVESVVDCDGEDRALRTAVLGVFKAAVGGFKAGEGSGESFAGVGANNAAVSSTTLGLKYEDDRRGNGGCLTRVGTFRKCCEGRLLFLNSRISFLLSRSRYAKLLADEFCEDLESEVKEELE